MAVDEENADRYYKKLKTTVWPFSKKEK